MGTSTKTTTTKPTTNVHSNEYDTDHEDHDDDAIDPTTIHGGNDDDKTNTTAMAIHGTDYEKMMHGNDESL